MKLYDFVGAPNPKKVRVYLAEKGLSIPCEQVNIVSGENRTPQFLKRNPLGGLPVLELDDGRHLTESLAIIEYLEELHPNPPMIGATPLERARVRELERIAELGVLSAVATIFQNTHPFMAGRFKQSADAADNARTRLGNTLSVVALGHRVSTRNGTDSGGGDQRPSTAAPRTSRARLDHFIAAAAERLRSTPHLGRSEILLPPQVTRRRFTEGGICPGRAIRRPPASVTTAAAVGFLARRRLQARETPRARSAPDRRERRAGRGQRCEPTDPKTSPAPRSSYSPSAR